MWTLLYVFLFIFNYFEKQYKNLYFLTASTYIRLLNIKYRYVFMYLSLVI